MKGNSQLWLIRTQMDCGTMRGQCLSSVQEALGPTLSTEKGVGVL